MKTIILLVLLFMPFVGRAEEGCTPVDHNGMADCAYERKDGSILQYKKVLRNGYWITQSGIDAKIDCQLHTDFQLTIIYPDGSTREIKDVCEKPYYDYCVDECMRETVGLHMPYADFQLDNCKQSCGEGNK